MTCVHVSNMTNSLVTSNTSDSSTPPKILFLPSSPFYFLCLTLLHSYNYFYVQCKIEIYVYFYNLRINKFYFENLIPSYPIIFLLVNFLKPLYILLQPSILASISLHLLTYNSILSFEDR